MRAEPQVHVLTDVAEVEALKPAWRKLLEDQGAPATTFQTPDWILAWMRHLIVDNAGTAARIMGVERQGELILVAPLAIVRRSRLCVLQWLGEPLLAYGDVVAQPGCDVAQLMKMVVERLQQDGDHIDVIHLPKVRADAAIAPFLKSFTRVPLAQKQAPYLDLTVFSNFDAFVASRSASGMKGCRRKRRRLEEMGRLDFSVHPAGVRAEQLGRQALELKLKWMQAYGKVSRIFADPASLESLLEFIGKEGSGAFVSELSLDDRPIALEIGFITDRRYYSYMGAMDLDYSRFSPGQLQILETLHWCFERGMEVFDLLPPDSDYKRLWANGTSEQNEWVSARSLPGAVYKNVVLRTIGPWSRHLYVRTPMTVRKPVQSLVQRLLKRR